MTALLRGATDPLGPTGQDPDAPRDLACDLTASQRVCAPAQPRPREPPDFDVPDASAVAGAGSVLSTLLVVLLVLALVAAIAWLAMVLVRQRRPPGDVDDDIDVDEDIDDNPPDRIIDDERPPRRWRRLAAEHRDAGRFREAIRCEYRALVGDLARAGFVDEIPGRTSGEERAQLRELAPSVAPRFDEAADLFDRAWFDDAPTSSIDDERFQASARVVLDDVMARR